MKKLILAIFSLLIFTITANAEVSNSKCPKWEAGQIVYYNGVQQNLNGSIAPSAFCWDIVEIEGYGRYFQNGILREYRTETLVTDESAADWFGIVKKYVYGQDFYGANITVRVHGFPQNIPTLTYKNTSGILVKTTNVYSTTGSILNGKEYTFFIRQIPVSNAIYLSDIDINGDIKVLEQGSLKDFARIR